MKTIPVSVLVLLGAFQWAAEPAGGAEFAPPEPRPSLEGLTLGARVLVPGSTQLPPEILVDRHLVRMERLLAADDPEAALEVMNEILAPQEEHDLDLENGFHFRYAEVAFAAGRTETAITSLNEYLVAAGRQGEFYREALELLDSAELRLEREEAERRRARDAPKSNGAAPPVGPRGTCFGTARRARRWWCCRGALSRWAATR